MKQTLIRLAVFFTLILYWSGLMAVPANPEPTLKQKIGQMLMLGFPGTVLQVNDQVVRDILAQRIGGVILFAQNPNGPGNIKNPQQLKQLTRDLQDYAQQAAKTANNPLYPLLISVDYEGGKVNQLKPKMGFPQTVTAVQFAGGTDRQAQRYAQKMAETLRAAGINIDFAPMLDVNVNLHNPIIAKYKRSYSTDPNKVAKFAQIFAQAMHVQGVLCAYKHFPGHGSSTTDSHKGFVDITATWQTYELTPYEKLLTSPDACELVMVGHLINHRLDPAGNPATLSKMMIANLLRNQLHFNGVIITDDMQMKAISEHYDLTTAVTLAINAGVDILLFANQTPKPQDAQALIDIIATQVQNGKISPQRIDEAYQNILQLKQKLAGWRPA